MKKMFSILLTAAMILSLAACAPQSKEITDAAGVTTESVTMNAEIEAAIKETIEYYDFEGVIYAVQNGAILTSYAKGTMENGEEITLDSPMPIGSVSKQFCAAAIMLLQEQGKLSVNDTLDKFFPEYTEGSKLTLHNLLSMRSGLPELTEESSDVVTSDNTEEENTASIKKWVFSQPLSFEPDESFAYANINYLMLSTVVEQVSGKKYADFLRECFFTPLKMTHTGTMGELANAPEWAQGAVFEHVDTQPGLTNGCGDVISNAADMTVWMNALSNGTAISADSFKAMTTDYSPEEEHYGYGMFLNIEGGVGHYGAIGDYSAFDYINEEKDFTLFAASNTIYPPNMTGLAEDLLSDLLG